MFSISVCAFSAAHPSVNCSAPAGIVIAPESVKGLRISCMPSRRKIGFVWVLSPLMIAYLPVGCAAVTARAIMRPTSTLSCVRKRTFELSSSRSYAMTGIPASSAAWSDGSTATGSTALSTSTSMFAASSVVICDAWVSGLVLAVAAREVFGTTGREGRLDPRLVTKPIALFLERGPGDTDLAGGCAA